MTGLSSDLLDSSLTTSLTSPAVTQSIVLHIEVILRDNAKCRLDIVRQYVHTLIKDNYTSLKRGTVISDFHDYLQVLTFNVKKIVVVDISGTAAEIVRVEQSHLDIQAYHLHDKQTRIGNREEDAEDLPGSLGIAIELPAKSLDGLWDTLVFENDVKGSLLRHVSSVLYFADQGVNAHLVSFQSLIFLHGPPGCGKTTLCRCLPGILFECGRLMPLALAQKTLIKLSHRYAHGQLIEINPASLFSRYFSESSKQVLSLFEDIYGMAQNTDTFICLLIDEVDSLTASRKTTMGAEPTDALRVVNVLLGQLDRLKAKANVLIMTTSNLIEASDPAFLDRADIVQYIGLPGPTMAYEILRSCLLELMRVGIILSSCSLLSYKEVSLTTTDKISPSTRLLDVAKSCSMTSAKCPVATTNLSGRSLRKLPILAYARHVHDRRACSIEEMLSALELVVLRE